MFWYKNYQFGKTATTKSQQIHLYFLLSFHLGIVSTVTFKMLHTFLLKRQSKRYTIIKFWHSNNSNLFCHNRVATITLETINKARAEFFGKHILKIKMVDNFRRWPEILICNMVKFFQKHFAVAFLSLMTSCQEMGKHKLILFLAQYRY